MIPHSSRHERTDASELPNLPQDGRLVRLEIWPFLLTPLQAD